MSEDAHTEIDGFTRLPISGWRCDHCGALTHIPDDHAARCSKRSKTSVYPPDSSTLYLETRCPECANLRAELAAAREDKPTAKEYEAVCTTNHSMEQEIAKLRGLCGTLYREAICEGKFTIKTLDELRKVGYDAAGRGEGTK